MPRKEPTEIELRVSEFKKDLTLLDDLHVVQKHITFGQPYALSENKYLGLKWEVASYYSIHPSNVVMVGSGRLGFSINPLHRYSEFGDDSDIDLAIVSYSLFEELWDEVINYWNEYGVVDWQLSTQFFEYLFRGWIRPDLLPQRKAFRFSSRWWEFFRQLTMSGQYGQYLIRAGLFKSWWHLENYQAIAVRACRPE